MSHSNAGFEPDSKDMNSNVGRKGSIVQGETVIHRQDLTEEEVKRESFKMKKNVVIISFAFMLLFTAFQSMANLQSSINKVNGLGTYSLSVIYGALVLSCMFLPSVIIKTISVKWTMVFSMFCYSTYIAAQFYPSFGTLIPGAIILGLGAAPMWSAKCTYLTQVGNKYAEVTGVQVEPIIVRFFGIFFLFFQFASVWGSLISSWVLSSGDEVAQISREELQYCGVNYCPKAAPLPSINTTLNVEPDLEDNFATSKTKLYTLAGIYLACSLVSATVVALFVDPLSRYGEHERDDGREKLSGLQLLVATFQHMTKPYQILVIPLTFWSGIEQGFFGADFTAGFVSCAYGVQNVGYVVIAYGVSDAVCSFSFGFLIKKVGRVPIFLFGTLVNIVVIVVFFTWSPNPEEQYVFYILAALWGVADAVWQTQINALYGVLFEKDEEAAFSNYRLWESLGFIVAYILQNNVCIYSKLWVMIGVLSTGMIGYLIIEAMEFRKRRG
ncbi:UNC93-like protein [Tigriopus californicus]|nr:UNC93-like protein [Tigriopus californicus]